MKPATFFLGCLVGGIGPAVVPLLVTTTQAQTKLLPFQGRLTDAAGSAIPDGAKVVEFKIYDAPTGGNVKWAGEVHKLSINGGLVNTMLGSKASLGIVDFSSATYLQITVDANNDGQITAADPPLLPRQSVVPAVYSAVAGQMQYRVNATTVAAADWGAVFDNGNPATGRIATAKLAADDGVTKDQISAGAVENAELAENAVSQAKMQDASVGTAELVGTDAAPAVAGAVTSEKIADGTIQTRDLATGLQESVTPPGVVTAYAAATAPAGWLICDGREVSQATYAALFAVIGTTHGVGDSATTFNLPDYRGRFLRGTDNGAGNDPDRASRTAMNAGGNTEDNVGSLQSDEFRSHKHKIPRDGHGTFFFDTAALAYTSNADEGFLDLPDGFGANNGYTGGNETRPKNAYVNYLIKY